MSPRKNRRATPGRPQGRGGGDGPFLGLGRHVEESGDGEWIVQAVAGANAVKAYRCPGCDQLIQPGVPHLVAWPADERGGADDRRHWHRPCWQARERRGPRLHRGRGAPRY
ncbi:ATP/GTP-binding protein [Actinomadura sp. NPDC047616]|uniref:ATP/GTP-binding protein n=1 Tax=Actinomadura sp. NPDC047616 TaxID=3155914 RepID=UPI0033E135D3